MVHDVNNPLVDFWSCRPFIVHVHDLLSLSLAGIKIMEFQFDCPSSCCSCRFRA